MVPTRIHQSQNFSDPIQHHDFLINLRRSSNQFPNNLALIFIVIQMIDTLTAVSLEHTNS